ncbi:hypothetical protein [Ralstonia syzygii]|uniref:DUF1097 domain-containing protein n=1 Tax=Ralstonia syzygii R24 TaxID=907261 RepID=G3A7J1_9RALS|nr:hypothetical protein [Ralstonia syzygii]CCA86466.1 membrane hypothetical protein [Ralstonia syzygii R24]
MSLPQNTESSSNVVGNNDQRPSPAKGFMILCSVVLVVGLLLALANVLGIADTWAAFLFALYWGAIERSNFRKLLHCAVGAAVGLTAAYFLHLLPLMYGSTAYVPCMIGVLVLVYCQTMGWFAIGINMVTMLFLLVGTIPAIQGSAQYPKLVASLALGVVYFSVVVWLANQVSRRTATRKLA